MLSTFQMLKQKKISLTSFPVKNEESGADRKVTKNLFARTSLEKN